MVLAVGAIALLIIGIMLYTILLKQEKEIEFVKGELMYVDRQNKKTPILKATSLPLIGKPDAIVERNGEYIPVEVKTGKTPESPYLNHTMQLMAYCLLTSEHYHKRPKGGYLKYPNKQFKIAYTKEAEASVIEIVKELIQNKKENKEFTCRHPEHNQ